VMKAPTVISVPTPSRSARSTTASDSRKAPSEGWLSVSSVENEIVAGFIAVDPVVEFMLHQLRGPSGFNRTRGGR